MKINPEQFHNVQGLSQIIQIFNKAGLDVDKVSGDQKPRRENNILMKSSVILFKSGQKLEMRLNVNGGNIYQWRLNGKVLAIKNYKVLDEAIKEVIAFVKENEPGFKARQAAAKIQRVTVPKLLTASMTLDEQIKTAKDQLVELDAESKIISQQIGTQHCLNAEKQHQLDRLNAQITTENERSKTLEAQLKKTAGTTTRSKAIFESASSPSTDPVTVSSLASFDKSGPQMIKIDIDSDFKEPSEYRGIIQAIESSRDIDKVVLRVNCNGVNIQAAQAIYSALLNAKAVTKAEIVSAVSNSAIVAMSCDIIKLTPFCSMMINNVSSGSSGKLGDMAGYSTFKSDYFAEWYAQLYAGFLTEEELKDIAKGQEFWLKEDQIRERLQNWKPIRERLQADGTLAEA